MTTIIIIALLLLAFYFGLFKYRKTSVLFLSIAIVAYLLVGSGWLALWLTTSLQSRYALLNKTYWKNRNAIVLLGAGITRSSHEQKLIPTMIANSRMFEALKQLQACKRSQHFCTLIISGGDTHKQGASEASVYQQAYIARGVDPANILLEGESMNTYQNAKFTSKLLRTGHYDHVALVTSALHMRRSLLYFNHFGIKAVPSPSDTLSPIISIVPLSYNFLVTDFAFHEYLGLLRYRFYNMLGWNKREVFQPSKAGIP